MSSLNLKRHARPAAAGRRLCCPECDRDVSSHHSDAATGKICLCPFCAAVMKRDGAIFRLLRTDEWWPILVKPEWYDLCEQRVQLLERLTSPGA